jgi:SAM-dependent methyltransferase
MRQLYKKYSDLLGCTPLHPQFFSKHFLDRQVKRRAKELSGLVFDLGCGFGPYRKYFSHAVYYGLDYPGYLCSHKAERPDIFGDLTCLPLADASLDGVLCTQVLEHIDEPVKALAEISRVLKHGGELLLSAPFFYPLHDEPHDYFRYSPHALKHLLSGVSMEVVEIVPQGGFVSLAGEFLNLFWIHKIYNLLFSGGYKRIIGFGLIPLFLILSFFNNLICLLFWPFDRERRFVMNYFLFARRH